jgi:putative ABC transport system permease protein
VTVIEGQLPAGARQVALGSQTADDLGVGVGDEVELGGEGIASNRATVTGIVVLPALGPILADRTGPGSGMLLPASALEADEAAIALSFIGIDLAEGAQVQPLLADIQEDFPSWDPFAEAALEFRAPVRPPEIVNAESMQAVPVLVGVLLMATAGVGLVVAVVVSVRTRQRELAVLRALGFTGRQLRASVRVQTVATMVGALVVGVPLGIVIGRVAWRLFADELGIVTNPSMPVLRIVVVVVGALVVAVVAAEAPARVAARTQPATALRSE